MGDGETTAARPSVIDAQAPRTGDIVAGKYRLEGMLGAGSMGSVWRAVHVVLGHSVAVKFLNQSLGQSTSAHARFEQEAKVSARLGEMSNHIARVSDYGVNAGHMPFVVMELLRGESLAQRLQREPKLPLVTVASIVQQLARALAAAHKAGVVHRDLKPANVFLCDTDEGGEPLVKLLDFGVAKLLEDDGFQPTMTGELVGTPSYMSPEQISGLVAIDARSDLWALAAITYRMAVGRNPFGVGPVVELVFRISSATPPAPSSVVPTLPPGLDAFMERGLSKNRETRFETARELSDALNIVAGLAPAETTLSPPSQKSRASLPAAPQAVLPIDGSVTSHAISTAPVVMGQSARAQGRAVRYGLPAGLAAVVVVGISVAALKWPHTAHEANTAASSSGPEATSALPPEPAAPVTTAAPVLSAAVLHGDAVSPSPPQTGVAVVSFGAPPSPSPSASTAPAVAATPATLRAAPPKPGAPTKRPGDGNAAGSALEKQSGELWRKNDEL